MRPIEGVLTSRGLLTARSRSILKALNRWICDIRASHQLVKQERSSDLENQVANFQPDLAPKAMPPLPFGPISKAIRWRTILTMRYFPHR